MTTLALIDRSPPLRPSTTADAAPVAACVEDGLELEKWLDQPPRPGALEGARALGEDLGEEPLAVTIGEAPLLLRSAGLRRNRPDIGDTGYWIRTKDLE